MLLHGILRSHRFDPGQVHNPSLVTTELVPRGADSLLYAAIANVTPDLGGTANTGDAIAAEIARL
jgi:hypothetical protein